MTEVWLTVAVVGVATIAMKAGPSVLLGGRDVPARVTGVFEALAPALLAALVITQTFSADEELVLDARAAGLGAAAFAVALRAPVLAAAVVAAVVAGLVCAPSYGGAFPRRARPWKGSNTPKAFFSSPRRAGHMPF